ncbi:MAG: urease subunit gamma [Actinobacteria bacterium]|uniref:urease n=1 Tax=freshwater metagenome TaxID=449393 RepID=A0A6J7I006_9ZZZZ|nr:urease subunit gamma [Actinomycetota bacterium]
MALTPGEADRLLLYTQGLLARERRERGLLLNVPEATALIANAVCEAARDGRDLRAAREIGRSMLSTADILPGVAEVVTEVSVEARFDDGTRLVVVRDPFRIGSEPAPASDGVALVPSTSMIRVENCARTPIGLTSHIHLAEVNPRLRLDRSAAYGQRLALPSGDTVWISPGETVELPVQPIGGDRIVIGNTGVVDGPLDDVARKSRALTTLRACGYLDSEHQDDAVPNADDAVAALMRVREASR